jgi:hypothetical protein
MSDGTRLSRVNKQFPRRLLRKCWEEVLKRASRNATCSRNRRRDFADMKRIAALAFLAVALFVFRSEGQAPDAREQKEQRLLNLIKEVQAQQTSMAQNQKKIDEVIVSVAETVRVARIYASRGGH